MKTEASARRGPAVPYPMRTQRGPARWSGAGTKTTHTRVPLLIATVIVASVVAAAGVLASA